jgi:hypothetical protein
VKIKAVHPPKLVSWIIDAKLLQLKKKAILPRTVPMGKNCCAAECALLAGQKGSIS